MSLTGRFFALYGFIQMIGVLGLMMPAALGVAVALSAPLLLLALWDRRTLADRTDFTLRVIPPKAPALGFSTELKILVQCRTRRALQQSQITLLTPPLELFTFENGKKPFHPRETTDGAFEHTFRAQVQKLGYTRIDKWPLGVLSSLGLFRRVFEAAVDPVEFRASPERHELKEQAFLELLQTQRVLHQGARLQAKARSADIFHSIRKYQYPDSIRHIDQKKSARYGELMTRIFEEHHNHHLVIAFDTGRAMSGDVRGSRKADYYLSAALALAENAVKSRDQVSLFAFSQGCQASIRRARSLALFQPLFRSAPEFTPRDEETDYSVIPRVLSSVAGSRSIVVVLTDLSKPSVQDALLEALQPVCRKHLTVVVSLNDRENDVEALVMDFAARVKENETSVDEFKSGYSDLLYGYWSKERHLLFREKFSRLGGSSLVINDADWLSSVERLYGLLRASRMA